MRLCMAFSLGVLALTMSGCGGEHSSARTKIGESEVTNLSEATKPVFDIDHGWHPLTKQCKGADLALEQSESYRLSEAYFVKIQKLSEDDHMLCKVGFVYERNVSSTNHANGVFREVSILRPLASKKTCWKKEEGGGLSDHVLSDDVFEMRGENMNMEMKYVASANQAAQLDLSLNESKDCPQGSLRLVLKY